MIGSKAGVSRQCWGTGSARGRAQRLTHGGCWGQQRAGTFLCREFQLFSKTLFRVKAKTWEVFIFFLMFTTTCFPLLCYKFNFSKKTLKFQ